MKFLSNFSTAIIFSITIFCALVSGGNLEEADLARIVNELNSMQCAKLVETIALKTPLWSRDYLQSKRKISLDESTLRRDSKALFFNRNDCFDKLKRWSETLPQNREKWARLALETELADLGRPDLAKYIKLNRRPVRYIEELSKIAGDDIQKPSEDSSLLEKNSHVEKSNGMSDDLARGRVTQQDSNPIEKKIPTEHFMTMKPETMGAHSNPQEFRNDTVTRWTAFLTLVGVIIITILSTVIFALYKKNRGNLCTVRDKCGVDECPMSDRSRRRSSRGGSDVERGEASDFVQCGPKRERRRSSILRKSYSPPSICVREEKINSPERKRRVSKIAKPRPEKREKRGCDSKCEGLKAPPPKFDKSTKTRETKLEEKSSQAQETKDRTGLKRFHERLASILRKDHSNCHCCKCTFSVDEKNNTSKCTGPSSRKKNICLDEKCQQNKLRSIAELCLSPEDTSPYERREPEKSAKKNLNNNKKKKKRAKSSKTEKKVRKNSNKTSDKEKEYRKKAPVGNSSGRSKDRRESRTRKRLAKSKKEKYNEEVCTRNNCGQIGRSCHEDVSNCD